MTDAELIEALKSAIRNLLEDVVRFVHDEPDGQELERYLAALDRARELVA